MKPWEEICTLADVAKVASSPGRLATLQAIRDGASDVAGLADRLAGAGCDLSRQAVGHFLNDARHAGLVASKPSGNRRVYALTTKGVAFLVRVDLLGRPPLAAAKASIEPEDDPDLIRAEGEGMVAR